MKRLRVISCVCVALVAGQVQAAITEAKSAPIVEGVASNGQLWLRDISGALMSFELKSGRKRILTGQGTVDIAADGSRMLALQHIGSGYEIVNLASGRSAAPILRTNHGVMALIGGPQLFVLGRDRVFRLEAAGWKEQKLDAQLQGGVQVSTVATDPEHIYIGFNRGEWGGGLYLVQPQSGHVEEVRRVDSNSCDGPLAHECDPVTGIIQDADNPACVVTSVGLAHLESHGRILRICGTKVDVLFSRVIPLQPDELDLHSTWPFFGLQPSPNGWVAVSYGRLFRCSHGAVTEVPLPRMSDWHGLRAALVDDELIAISTDVNWMRSVSGPTPLLVSIRK